ncbi:MAG: AlpA family phage regulatory protein [bacterium]|nr:AlpA family phage regulatory protein [bacterium]
MVATTSNRGGRVEIIRLPEVMKMTGVSRTSIWRWSRTDRFPRSVRLGTRHIGWIRSEVEDWIERLEHTQAS